MQEPELLLLDEPLSNLDAKLRVKVREDIREIQQRLGITTLIVTHDQEEAMSMSDRIAVMNNGKIEQFSRPGDLYTRPETEFVATFIGSLNRVEGAFVDGALVAGGDVIGIRPEHVTFTDQPSPGSRPALVERVVPHGHFHEIYLARDDTRLRAFATGSPPLPGARGHSAIGDALTFRQGRLVATAGARA